MKFHLGIFRSSREGWNRKLNCTTCIAGYYGFGHDTCTACPKGTFKPEIGNGNETAACEICPNNTSTLLPNSTSPLHCECKEGMWGDPYEGGCENCPGNTFKFLVGNGNRTQVCKTCPAGTTSPAGSLGCDCRMGFEPAVDGCSPCQDGFYKSSISQAMCTQCPLNSDTAGASQSEQVESCVCIDGYEGFANKSESCTACPLHHYKAAGNGNCTSCPLNSITEEVGSATRDACLCIEGYVLKFHSSSLLRCVLILGWRMSLAIFETRYLSQMGSILKV